MPARPADDFAHGADRLPRSWIVTGGARGITGEIAQRLSQLYHPRLHLFGRQPYPAGIEPLFGDALEKAKKARYAELKAERPGLTALEWQKEAENFDKNAEIGRTLIALAQRGSEVYYHSVDLSDEDAVKHALDAIRAHGPIEGIIHGAGIEIAKPLAKKTDAIFEATVSSKVDGLVHLLRHTAQDPLTHIVAFSSVSGRFGGHGQTDYSLANEAMSRILAAHRVARPDVRSTSIAWPAWGEVGLAARSSARVFLERTGQRFMSPAEGANHFIRELWSGLPESEVTISDGLDLLDMDHLLTRDSEMEKWNERAIAVANSPLLGQLVLDTPQRTLTESTISADRPFLAQHRMGTTPILPGVIGLEALSELAGLDSDRYTAGEVTIFAPLKIVDTVLVRLDRDGDRLSLTATTRRPDGIVLEADRTYVSGRRVARRPLPSRTAPRWPVNETGIAYPYPAAPDQTPGSRAIFHGPVFRAVEAVLPTGSASGLARLIVPPVEALIPGSKADRWRMPAALLDGALQATGLLARVLFDAFALPAGFGRIDVSPRAVLASGEIVLVDIQLRREGEDIVADLLGFTAGEPLFFLEGYRARGPRSS